MKTLLSASLAIFFMLLTSAVEAKNPKVVSVIGISGEMAMACSGFVLSDNTILTSAHCVYGADNVLVDGEQAVSFEAHPKFKMDVFGLHDVAIVFTKKKYKNNGCRIAESELDKRIMQARSIIFNVETTVFLEISISSDILIIANGRIVQGMSGGPLYDQQCNIYGITSFSGSDGSAGFAALNREKVAWINLRQKETSRNTQE